MIKSSESEQARRVNATVSLLQKKASPPEVLSWLVGHYRISPRQAYRYLQQAQANPSPLPVPEKKGVFTVKLSIPLIRQVRRQARQRHSTISEWVDQALRQYLNQPKDHG